VCVVTRLQLDLVAMYLMYSVRICCICEFGLYKCHHYIIINIIIIIAIQTIGGKDSAFYVGSDFKPTDLHIYILDAVPPVYVISNHVDSDKLTTANGGTSMSSSARLGSQSR